MGKSSAANVIDLEAFRQRKMREERGTNEEATTPSARDAAMLVPVWFCWVPVWTPVLG
jgi:hypothetical protein